jgi:alcohol dehydrogenase, propanol-preferring
MKAMILEKIVSLDLNPTPLTLVAIADPLPGDSEILIKVSCCGVCHTELDEIEGRTPPSKFPMIPGHQVVGRVVQRGSQAKKFKIDERVGIAWINSACGVCEFCLGGNENLCSHFRATGRDAHGGYAEYTTVNECFAYHIPALFSDAEAAPLLCAGAIGYRSIQLSGLRDGQKLGLTGFGASAHLVLKMVKHQFPKTIIFVFARSIKERRFALELGAAWAGDIEDESPEKLHSIIDTTPVWAAVVESLKNLLPGGRLVINAIRKEDIDKNYLTRLDYQSDLWMEKEIKSVANVTRKDVQEFLSLAAAIPIKPEIEEFPLERANDALMELKQRKIRGAKVLRISPEFR